MSQKTEEDARNPLASDWLNITIIGVEHARTDNLLAENSPDRPHRNESLNAHVHTAVLRVSYSQRFHLLPSSRTILASACAQPDFARHGTGFSDT
jgi:hypothetical protein